MAHKRKEEEKNARKKIQIKYGHQIFLNLTEKKRTKQQYTHKM